MVGPVWLSLTLLLGATQDVKWTDLTPKAAGFSVKMPGTATEKKQKVKTAAGDLNVVLWVAEGRNDSVFVVSYSDFAEVDPKAVEKKLDHARDGAVNSARGKLRSEKAIELAGQPGREIVIEKAGETIVRMRIYLAKRRLFQVMVLGSGPIFATKDVETFLDSFRLNK